MTFKDMKSGFPVYLLDRTALTYEQGRVMSVSLPHADLQSCNYGKMYVDITIQYGGKQNTYAVCEAEPTAYAGTLLIATDKEYITNEVRAINAQAEEAIAKVPEAQHTVSACKALLAELDTAYKDRQATETRFQRIDERFSGMESKIDRILEAMGRKEGE